MAELAGHRQASGITRQRLRTSQAFHNPMMDTAPASKGLLMASLSVSLGGTGGAGGKAGAATILGEQAVQTSGQLSPGLLAQSIGGGGGNGGFTASGSVTTVVAMATSIGGPGGTGGTGGGVLVRADAPVTTGGHQSAGVIAQSIGGNAGNGGNGGNGGSAVSGSASTGNPAMAVSVGAAGAAGATGGTGQAAGGVGVTGRNTVLTQGQGAIGVLAQSIGGGGGGGSGGNSTSGGAGTKTASLALGGTVGITGNGSGGAVTVDSPAAAAVSTAGHFASAAVAQSIGGGGVAAAASSDSSVFSGALALGGRNGIACAGGKVGLGATGSVAPAPRWRRPWLRSNRPTMPGPQVSARTSSGAAEPGIPAGPNLGHWPRTFCKAGISGDTCRWAAHALAFGATATADAWPVTMDRQHQCHLLSR